MLLTPSASFKLSSYSEDFGFKEGVNNVVSNQFGISRLPETWITADELYGVFFCCCCSPAVQLYTRMLLFCCEAPDMSC